MSIHIRKGTRSFGVGVVSCALAVSVLTVASPASAKAVGECDFRIGPRTSESVFPFKGVCKGASLDVRVIYGTPTRLKGVVGGKSVALRRSSSLDQSKVRGTFGSASVTGKYQREGEFGVDVLSFRRKGKSYTCRGWHGAYTGSPDFNRMEFFRGSRMAKEQGAAYALCVAALYGWAY